ncbi:hypothetical protein [Niabella beijingensis]|uniref:hypothetical protein n=1 Tax=Niabella beijingensis TaxID=2872700 RepID=UPI001CC13499|nr:hypothetical protein [Niabella beijingensis]MBZ4192023.1 hypothetical protein [Niabella beijingensis]
MKLSDKATAYLLVKANTNSEWDNCNFAIIHITEEWKKEQQKRIEFLAPLQGNYQFQSMNFYDTAVDFYNTGEEDKPDIENLLGYKDWAFVELDKNELASLTPPENRLDCYRIALRANGTGYYTAYGKHTSEEFWTEDILLTQIIQ